LLWNSNTYHKSQYLRHYLLCSIAPKENKMEKSLKILWVISIIITQQLAFWVDASHSRKRIVPALYVFGDSTVDVGNNNNLNTLAKANAFPYGIDFNNCSMGRFSNGKTFVDLIGNYFTFLLKHHLCLFLVEI